MTRPEALQAAQGIPTPNQIAAATIAACPKCAAANCDTLRESIAQAVKHAREDERAAIILAGEIIVREIEREQIEIEGEGRKGGHDWHNNRNKQRGVERLVEEIFKRGTP